MGEFPLHSFENLKTGGFSYSLKKLAQALEVSPKHEKST
jgi:hypothetical protein